jgi:hypothetical protein
MLTISARSRLGDMPSAERQVHSPSRSACGAFAMAVHVLCYLLGRFCSRTPPPLRQNVGKGPMSAIEERGQVTAVGRRMGARCGKRTARRAGAAVDFSREMVVGFLWGSRPTAGCGSRLGQDRRQQRHADRRVCRNPPSRGTDYGADSHCAIYLAAIPKHDGALSPSKSR